MRKFPRRKLILESLESRHVLASISGHLFHDSDGNGVQEPGEVDQAGVGVFIDSNGNEAFDVGEPFQITDGTGSYFFDGLADGTHRVGVVESSFVSQVSPTEFVPGSTQIPRPAVVRGQVYDPLRRLFYVATGEGTVERYDVVNQQMLAPLEIGHGVSGVDITQDGKYLFLGDISSGTSQGFIYKYDLANDTVDSIAFDIGGLERGVASLVITANDTVLWSMNVNGSSGPPLREYNIATGEVTVARSSVWKGTRMERNQSGTTVFFFMPGLSNGPTFVYDAVADNYPASRNLGSSVSDGDAAVHPDGHRIVFESHFVGMHLFDLSLNEVTVDPPLRHHKSGLTFDPIRDTLYAVNSAENIVYAHDGDTWAEQFSFPVGEDLNNFLPSALMDSSREGRYAFLTSTNSIRMYDLEKPVFQSIDVAGNQMVTGVEFGVVTFDFPIQAANDEYVVGVNAAVTEFPVTENDLGDILSSTIVSVTAAEEGGATSINGRSIDYTPPANFRGVDRFEYTIQDSQGRQSTTEVVVTVKPVNGLGDLLGFAWDDLNRNGEFDAGESSLAGHVVYLDLNGNGIRDGGELARTTAADGSYEFLDIAPGDYQVRQELVVPRSPTLPVTADNNSTLLPVVNGYHLFDPFRSMLYSVGGSFLHRYDLIRGEYREPWEVGVSLSSMDITDDGRFLYIGEARDGSTNSFVRKVDLETGEVVNLDFVQAGLEKGVYDLAIGVNDRGLITTNFAGTGSTPFREFFVDVDQPTIRPDKPTVFMSLKIERSADRSLFFFAVPSLNTGSVFMYDTVNDTFFPQHNTFLDNDISNTAVNGNGTLIAHGTTFFDRDYNTVAIIPSSFDTGFEFDPNRDILYAGISSTNEIVAYDVARSEELLRIPIGENVNRGRPTMSISQNAQHLALSTPSGIRLYEIGVADAHRVTIAPDTINIGLDFGSAVTFDAPSAADDTLLVNVDSPPVTFDPLANDILTTAGNVTITQTTAPTAGGTVAIVGNQLQYTPPAGFRGVDRFRYMVTNERGQFQSALVTVTVKPNNGLSDIQGQLWHDLDRDSEFEPGLGESILTDRTVYLDLNDNGAFDAHEPTAITGATGHYAFEDIAPGSYEVRQLLPEGWRQTSPLHVAPSSTLIAAGVGDHVYDPLRNMVYLADGDLIQRYDIAGGQLLAPFAVGGTISAIDITPDSGYLFAGDSTTGDGVGFIRQVDLETGQVIEHEFARPTIELGVFDLVAMSAGNVLFTTSFAGSGQTPLREMNVATGQIEALFSVRYASTMERSSDHTRMIFQQHDISSGDFFTYDATTDTFSPESEVWEFIGRQPVAVGPRGDQFALLHSLIDTNRATTEVLSSAAVVGLAFAEYRNMIFTADHTTDEVVVFHSVTGREAFRFPIGDDLNGNRRRMYVTNDGARLVMSTSPGDVRMFDIASADSLAVTVGGNEITIDNAFGSFRESASATFVDAKLFYNDSAYDGFDPAANAADDAAIDHAISALMPGETGGPGNISTYAAGINGLIIDIDTLANPSSLSASDFEFRIGNDSAPANWLSALSPIDISVRSNEGAGGSDRITITWPSGAVSGAWLETRVLATPNTGLSGEQVFYFGSAPGDTRNSQFDVRVNAIDFLGVRISPTTFLTPTGMINPFDLNRDRQVNAIDLIVVRDHVTTAASALNFIVPPEPVGGVQAKSATTVRFSLVENSFNVRMVRLSTDTSRKKDLHLEAMFDEVYREILAAFSQADLALKASWGEPYSSTVKQSTIEILPEQLTEIIVGGHSLQRIVTTWFIV